MVLGRYDKITIVCADTKCQNQRIWWQCAGGLLVKKKCFYKNQKHINSKNNSKS